MITNEIISFTLILITFIYLFIIIFIIKARYVRFTDAVRKYEPDFIEELGVSRPSPSGGSWFTNTYLFRLPLPINYKTKDSKIKKLIISHDNSIKLYWISMITILPIDILILNLIN